MLVQCSTGGPSGGGGWAERGVMGRGDDTRLEWTEE